MQLQEIDKTTYRKHLRRVFAAIAAALIIITLGASTLFIHLFSTPSVPHFWHNLSGVVFAAAVVAFTLHKLRHLPFMFEVSYIWDLKQQLNRIYRKQNRIEKKVNDNDHNALIIMNYLYRGSKQLYELDDNTITMSELNTRIRVLDKKMEDAGISPSTDAYDPAMLDQF